MTTANLLQGRDATRDKCPNPRRVRTAGHSPLGECAPASRSLPVAAAEELQESYAVIRQTPIRPRLRHFALKTADLEPMVDWYSTLLGITPTRSTPMRAAANVGASGRIVWIGNSQGDDGMALIAHPALTDDTQRSRHKGLHHVAFELPSVDDLLSVYVRMRTLGVKPVLAADYGATTSFYYDDPDGNRIELMVDNVAETQNCGGPIQNSDESGRISNGTEVDPEQMLAARTNGMSITELHERAYAGEFGSASGFYKHYLAMAGSKDASGHTIGKTASGAEE